MRQIDGRNGAEIREQIAPHASYLSGLANDLGLIDPVTTYFEPVLGQWTDLHNEAQRWRSAAVLISKVASQLDEPLVQLDAGWEGKNADAFVAYIGRISVAGVDTQESFVAMGKALDDLGVAVRHVVSDMAAILLDTAEVTSESAALPVNGGPRARKQLEEASQLIKNLYESVQQLMQGFVRFCDEIGQEDARGSSTSAAHRYPSEGFTFPEGSPENPYSAEVGGQDELAAALDSEGSTVPADASGSDVRLAAGHETTSVPVNDLAASGALDSSTPQPSAVSPQNAGAAGGMPMGMMPMGGMGAGQGGDVVRRSKQKRTIEPEELFGDELDVAPPVIGKD